ncbi:MAG: CBS domain-containing protein [Desulfobacterales bacterium]|nr:CBS domain-containing protein [Desulfobacterales bacterium]MDJ0882913.1 CBS domain-containing protein [Desulfobacterales bacterium]
MKSIKVYDIMIPLSEYATVSEEATMQEAVQALERAQNRFRQNRYGHQTVLVTDRLGFIVGQLSQLDLILALEKGYRKRGLVDPSRRRAFGLSYIPTEIDRLKLWQKPLTELCQQGHEIKIQEIMQTPQRGQYIGFDATLDEAVHRLAIGRYRSLLVTQWGKIAGILRLCDVFERIHQALKNCPPPNRTPGVYSPLKVV